MTLTVWISPTFSSLPCTSAMCMLFNTLTYKNTHTHSKIGRIHKQGTTVTFYTNRKSERVRDSEINIYVYEMCLFHRVFALNDNMTCSICFGIWEIWFEYYYISFAKEIRIQKTFGPFNVSMKWFFASRFNQ